MRALSPPYPERMLSAANLIEAGIVMQARRGDDGARDVDLVLAKLRVEIVPFTARQPDTARIGFEPMAPAAPISTGSGTNRWAGHQWIRNSRGLLLAPRIDGTAVDEARLSSPNGL